MRKLFESRGARRLLSLAVCAAMVLSLLPMPSFAAEGDGQCAHHTEHTAECGYVAAVAGQPCTHVCGDECYTVTKACTHVHGAACYSDGVLPAEGEEKTADACAHVCTEESGCVTKTPACVHTAHDEACGYVEAVAGKPCGYVCTQCAGEPQPEGKTDKVITGWAWVDPDEWLDETGSFAMPGVTEDTPAFFEDVVEYLPTKITADGETLTLGAWVCNDYPMETGTSQGKYVFQTTLPAGCILSEGGNVLRVGVTIAPLNLTEDPEAAAYDTVTNISYLDADGTEKTAACTAVTADYLSANNNTLSAGWYVVQGNVTTSSRVTVSGDVHLILANGCDLKVNGGIQVQDNSTGSTPNTNALTLYAQSTAETTMGKLTTQNVDGEDAAIGGSGSSGGGSGGEITINGGVVRATSERGAAIGGGGGLNGGSGVAIAINGGVVEATSNYGAAIGGGDGGSGRFSTGTNGNAVIFASSIADQSGKSSWSGVIFEGGAGKVYGSLTLPLGLPIPENHSLTLDMDGKSLTFTQGTGITLNSGSTLKLSGPGSFPGGISVSGGTLAGILQEGWAYTRNGAKLPVSDEITLSGAIGLSKITVTITTQPTDVTMTYGETKSLSVTAEPVTSGDTVSYQWYQNGTALTGETQSTLSLPTLNVGTYQIYCAVTCGDFTVNSSTAKVTVGKAAGSVTIPGEPGKIYDGKTVSMDGKYTTTGGTGKVEYKVKGAADSTYTTTAPKDAGNYTVRVTAEDANHTAAYATKDFTITPKTVSLTVTVKNKAFDDTTTAEIDTVNTNGIVAGDDVQVASGTPTFTRKTPGETIPVSFTEFKLEGADAGNYLLTQPTGVTGKILPTTNYLDLTNNPDFAKQTEVWVDGVKYPVETENGCYVNLPASGDLLTGYTYKKGNSTASHENYPTTMTVYRITRGTTGATLTRISAFDDLLQYSGCAIRITGKQGIRMITSLTKDNKNALKGAGLAGYTLEEYGTVVQWADKLGGKDLTLSNGKSNYAYKKGVADPVFAISGNLTQYTNVLVWDSLTNTQLGQDIVMRPYIRLSKDGQTVTLYGGCVNRSIGYIAYQNRAVFKPGTAAYQYVWDIIHAVYGNQYNSEYQG